MKKYDVKYMHLRNRDCYGHFEAKGGYTIAYVPANEERTCYDVGVARCSKKDNYVKKLGRTQAKERLNSIERYRVVVDPDQPHHWMLEDIVDTLERKGFLRYNHNKSRWV